MPIVNTAASVMSSKSPTFASPVQKETEHIKSRCVGVRTPGSIAAASNVNINIEMKLQGEAAAGGKNMRRASVQSPIKEKERGPPALLPTQEVGDCFHWLDTKGEDEDMITADIAAAPGDIFAEKFAPSMLLLEDLSSAVTDHQRHDEHRCDVRDPHFLPPPQESTTSPRSGKNGIAREDVVWQRHHDAEDEIHATAETGTLHATRRIEETSTDAGADADATILSSSFLLLPLPGQEGGRDQTISNPSGLDAFAQENLALPQQEDEEMNGDDCQVDDEEDNCSLSYWATTMWQDEEGQDPPLFPSRNEDPVAAPALGGHDCCHQLPNPSSLDFPPVEFLVVAPVSSRPLSPAAVTTMTMTHNAIVESNGRIEEDTFITPSTDDQRMWFKPTTTLSENRQELHRDWALLPSPSSVIDPTQAAAALDFNLNKPPHPASRRVVSSACGEVDQKHDQRQDTTACQRSKAEDDEYITSSKSAPCSSSSSSSSPFNDKVWNQRYSELKRFIQKHGHCLVPSDDGTPYKALSNWVKRQRFQAKKRAAGKPSRLFDERVQALERIGFIWNPRDALWEERFEEFKAFKKAHGHSIIPINVPEYAKLSTWVKSQRRRYVETKSGARCLDETFEGRIARLNAVGFAWAPRKDVEMPSSV
mmetsp:Transcript_22942/g.65005  ORF Transcript_22942/g.65005 Transcript_22942/m.65005 type:complete len:648 (-) Transcript_22942:187-2130(-)